MKTIVTGHGIMLAMLRCIACVAAVLAFGESRAFEYEIRGAVTDSLYFGKKLVLHDVSVPKKGVSFVKIDSCVCSPDGSFSFSGEYGLNDLAMIGAVYDIPGGVRTDYIGTLALTEGATTMYMDERCPLTGSRENCELRKMFLEINGLMRSLSSKEITKELFKAKASGVCRNILSNNADNAAGRCALYYLSQFISEKEWYEIYLNSSSFLQQHAPVDEYAHRVESILTTEIGEKFIDLKGIDSFSEEISLSHFVENGKPTIVDFWASWCQPCLEEIKSTLKPLYEKYGKDGAINIIGVGVNDTSERLLAAMERLGMEWPQIMESTVPPTQVYGFNAIPFILVVDSDGKILARDLRGEALTALIDSLIMSEKE